MRSPALLLLLLAAAGVIHARDLKQQPEGPREQRILNNRAMAALHRRKMISINKLRTADQKSMSMILPAAQIPPAGILDPACIIKYQQPIVMPPALVPSARYANFDEYKISVKRIDQQVMPPTIRVVPGQCPVWTTAPKTAVLAYGTTGNAATFNWPGFTMEAVVGRPTAVQFYNEIINATTGRYAEHPLKEAVDQTLHWANPAGIGGHTDMSPCAQCQALMFSGNMGACQADAACVAAASAPAYTGPVPIITHVHGQINIGDHSDGYTEAWYMPNSPSVAADGYAQNGTWMPMMQKLFTKYDTSFSYPNLKYGPGVASHWYPNAGRPCVQFYHDHALGITRLNVYAGMAGFWILRKSTPTTTTSGDITGMPYPVSTMGSNPRFAREIPIAMQERAFQQDGQFWYPIADYQANETLPQGFLAPKWIPELTATMTGLPVTDPGNPSALFWMINGRAWPVVDVAADTYRLRLLNGCNTKAVVVYFSKVLPVYDPTAYGGLGAWNPANDSVLIPFVVSANEAGNFPQLVLNQTMLEMVSAQRFDILFDFSRFPVGTEIYMLNWGSETPWGGDNYGEALTEHTSQFLKFRITASVASPKPMDAARVTLINNNLRLDAAKPYPPANVARKFAFVEESDPVTANVLANFIDSFPTPASDTPVPKLWVDPVDTYPKANTVEDWEIVNFTPDTHPVHLHEMHFEVVSHTLINITNPDTLTYVSLGIPFIPPPFDIWRAPCANNPAVLCPIEHDTVTIYPNTVLRIRVSTGIKSGLYVWHCHLLEHEDNEMMRPFCVGKVTPAYYINPRTGVPMCPAANN